MLYNTIRLNLLQTLWNRIRIRINVSSGIVMILFIVLALGPLLVCCDRGTNIGCFRKPGSGDTNNMHLNIRADSVETCISNCEKLFYRYAVLDGSSCSCTHILSVEAVTPSDCDRLCPDKTQQFCGGNETESYYDTGLRNPGPVTNVKFKNITEDTISVSWNPPESSSLLVQYKVLAEVLETYSTRQLHNPEWSVSKEERQFDLVGLHPGTRYNISIISMGDSGTTDGTGLFSLPQWTEVGEPDNEPLEPKVLSADETSQIIEIYPVVNNNGPVSKYQLVVLFVTYGLMQTFDETQLRSYNESQELGMLYYIAAELDLGNNTRRIKIGDGRIYNGFYNAPLPPKSHIHVAVGVISTLNGVTKRRYGQTSHDQHSHLGEELFALDDESSNSVMVVVLSVFCVILAILLAASIAMFVYVRRHARANRKRLTEVHELHPQNGVAGGSHEMENSGFIGDELGVGDFKQQLQALFDRIPSHQLVPRNTLSLDIDNILGTGRFGDVIHGNLLRMNGVNQGSLGHSSQIHVISEDMEGPDQVLFLKELDQLLRIQPHPLFMTLLGICSTPDWMYIIFEDTGRTLKKRLIESRLPMDVDPNRMTSLSEEFVVRIMSNIADAMQYLGKNLIVHKQVCSYNVWMTASDEPKLSIFGPTLYIENRKLVDLARYQAPEVLRYQHHTLKSDVWSFACLAWECCTVGGTLYSNVISSDLLARIRTGSRPEQTPFIFNDLYQVLLNCWELDANDRMSMEEVAHSLRQMLHTSPKHVLSFDRHSGLTLPYYLPLLEIKNFDE